MSSRLSPLVSDGNEITGLMSTVAWQPADFSTSRRIVSSHVRGRRGDSGSLFIGTKLGTGCGLVAEVRDICGAPGIVEEGYKGEKMERGVLNGSDEGGSVFWDLSL